MIKLIRLDERLIHGQIAIKWSRHTNVTHIIVANDSAASNSVIKKSLMMAAPGHLKTQIVPVEQAINLLNDPRCADLKVLVIVKNPKDMNTVLDACPTVEVETINIGNYGRVEPKNPGYDRVTYGRNLYIDETELPEFKKIVANGRKAIYQTTPEEPAEDLETLLNK